MHNTNIYDHVLHFGKYNSRLSYFLSNFVFSHLLNNYSKSRLGSMNYLGAALQRIPDKQVHDMGAAPKKAVQYRTQYTESSVEPTTVSMST